MEKTLVITLMLWLVTGCSGSIRTSKISDATADASATGLRYFVPQRIEITTYHVTLPAKPTGGPLQHRIERLGDVITDTIADPGALWQVNYDSALFASQSVNLGLGDKGAVKAIGLTSASGNTPIALGALQGIQKGLETQRDFDKAREQAKIDQLNRQTNLIKAKADLEKALQGK